PQCQNVGLTSARAGPVRWHGRPRRHSEQPDDRTTVYDRYLRENYLFGHGQRCWIVCTCIESSPYLKPLSFWAAYFVGPWRIGPQLGHFGLGFLQIAIYT